MLELTRLTQARQFPPPSQALDEPNGLLAFGGDLSVERLILAYRNGIFPWFSEDEPILWWSPNPRGIMEIDEFHCSRSLTKTLKRNSFTVTLNHDFEQVIQACANVPRGQSGTWITESMCQAYISLHRSGHAHSIEIWQENDELVGGLYGVLVGRVFCGESMFHTTSNASKVAYYFLVELAKQSDLAFIDCQMLNPHLASLGCKEISRHDFLVRLRNSVEGQPSIEWGKMVLNR